MSKFKFLPLALFLIATECKNIDKTFEESFTFPVTENEDADYWMKKGRSELEESLFLQYGDSGQEFTRAKNIIIFIGDGMSIPTVTATRIYKGQQKYGKSGEESSLVFEEFPNFGMMKTYTTDYQVPDSASTASAIFHGVKTKYSTVGYDNSIEYNNATSMKDAKKVPSILKWAQEAGKSSGIVTNTRLTHATPAATYAHIASRNWECDSSLPKDGQNIQDIALQLIENEPGKNFNVILGGGLASFRPRIPRRQRYDTYACVRKDGRDLLEEWTTNKISQGYSAKVVGNVEELRSIDYENTDYLLGAFADSNMDYEDERNPKIQPSLVEMTESAIKILRKNKGGFFLAVEGGRIDHAHHDGNANRALSETLKFDEAIEKAIQMVNIQETLVIVTADHSHGLTINGYPKRGADIRGLAGSKQKTMDGMPYTILSYANGPGAFKNKDNQTGNRLNLTNVDTTGMNYHQPSLVPIDIEIHAGDDVGAWAVGPGSKLIHRIHEQSYLAHAMAYSGCLGPYKEFCKPSTAASTLNSSITVKIDAIIVFIALITIRVSIH